MVRIRLGSLNVILSIIKLFDFFSEKTANFFREDFLFFLAWGQKFAKFFCFSESINNFCLSGLWLESSISRNITSFFRVVFLFFELRMLLSEIYQVLIFQNIRKAFFWENVRNFSILELVELVGSTSRQDKNFF